MSTSTSITTISSLQNDTSATTEVNNNFAAINSAMTSCLSTTGQAPNQMAANLDMNSNRILNLPTPVNLAEPMRLADANTLNGGGTISAQSMPTGGTTGQVLTKNSATNYDTSWATTSLTLNGSPVTSTGAALTVSSNTLNTVAFSGDVTSSPNSFSTTIAPGAVTNSKFRQSAGTSLVGNSSSSSGNVSDITGTSNQIPIVNSGGTGLSFTSVGGDLNNSGGTFTIQPAVVTGSKIATNTVANSNLAQATAYTIKGNTTGSTANVTDLSFFGSGTGTVVPQKASPVSADTVLLADSAASGQLKYATVGSIGTIGAVSSIAGNTGAFTLGSGLTNSTNVLLADASFHRGYIAGLNLSNDGTTPNSVLDISAGVAVDSTNATFIKGSAFTKTTGGTWTAGSGNAGMGTGLTIAASTWYHVFAIINGGSYDVYFDTSVTAANAPASTTAFRRIGSFKTDGSSHIIAFTQNGDEFLLTTPVHDLNAQTVLSANRTLVTLASIPTGIKVNALYAGSSQAVSVVIYFTSPDQADTAPGSGLQSFGQGSDGNSYAGELNTRTNTSAQVAVRSTSNTTCHVWTKGWVDTRGRFA